MQSASVYPLKTRINANGKHEVWDTLRKKYIALTPEEWVRQQFIQKITQEFKYPAALIAVERGIRYNGLSKRIDLMVFDREGKPFLLAEFKSPEVALTHNTVFQTAVYNHEIKAPFVVLDNFYESIIFFLDADGIFRERDTLPTWPSIPQHGGDLASFSK
jgi:hypothetical protein